DGLAGVRFLLKGQFAAIEAIIRAHFSFYRQWGATLKKRKAVAETIAKYRIAAQPDRSGIYHGSIVWAYYVRGIRTFRRLFSS
ncbi:MAG TPA: bifunctional riboflavin kinase/FAD synthetase, partial [Saprospiraceae bacterium]|nr:bifunctional riboflavin kinase/FAD synthetase [Saprospiraceae bacterium]